MSDVLSITSGKNERNKTHIRLITDDAFKMEREVPK